MRGGIPLFRFRGIQVFLHWTFLLLPAYIALTGVSEGSSWPVIASDIGQILIVFACVVLHEFGHALTAARFGVATRDITLLPIGGVASLERMPEEPRQEFWITVAGPMVNLLIAGIAFLVLAVMGLAQLTTELFGDISSWTGVLTFLVVANISLFLFNLIPAFPMDGGRILRSALGMWLPRPRATRIATVIGRILAVGFVGYGLYSGAAILAIIGVFIFMAAGSEARIVQQKADRQSLRVGQLVRNDLIRMEPTATVQDAWNALTLVDQHTLAVTDQGLFRGLVGREELRSALQRGEGVSMIGPLTRHVPSVAVEESALTVLERMVQEQLHAVMAISNGAQVGVVLRRDLEKALGPIGTSRTA
ncbi:MAG TPA: site-2 protease family protein [Flavobacteriales bacterium]|nr:site-2 protease family protein [Flavobacteriales bacterium]